MVEFYGGDLAGIEQRLDYLHDLGVNALYLNPIFTAYSNHRYDVVDYFNVDPHLGGNEALASLRRATKERGMRVILDIVPNHCGADHPWFREAQKDLNADSAGFFTFSRHPDEYLCWLGVRSLPKLNYANTQLRARMYSGDPSVFRQWLRPPYSIDGWRIDVANMLGRQGADQLGREVAEGIRWATPAPRGGGSSSGYRGASPCWRGSWRGARNPRANGRPPVRPPQLVLLAHCPDVSLECERHLAVAFHYGPGSTRSWRGCRPFGTAAFGGRGTDVVAPRKHLSTA
jgi:hypothetical protein